MNNLSKFHFRLNQSILRYLGIGIFILVIILGAIFGIEYVQKSSVIEKVISLATTKKPEAFTELYFENHTNFPTKITVNVPYRFSFTVHNLENKNMVYPYEVSISSGSAKLPILTGTLNLKQNEYKNVVVAYASKSAVGHEEIIVNLINKKQHINFWIGNKN